MHLALQLIHRLYIRNGFRGRVAVILQEGKQEEKAEVYQITQDLD